MIHRHNDYPRRAGLAVALGLACFAAPAYAQTRPDAGTILDTVREQPTPTRPSPGLQLPPPPKPAMQVGPNIKVQVKSFRVTGNTLFSEAELLKELAEFTNKELDFEGLQEATRAVTSFYRTKGYFLAQAYLPKQELNSGVVEIYILEGKIGKVEVKPGTSARLRTSIAAGYLRGVEQGSIAHEATVERPLLLLQDLPGVTVQSTVGPGANVGEADLTAELGDDGRRITGVVEADNFGNKFAGALRLGGQLYLNNPLGFGDLLTVRGLVAQDQLTELLGVSYAIPVGYWGTKLGVSASRLRYELGGSLAPSGADGEADIASLLLVHPIVRRRDWNLFGQISAEGKDLEDRVATNLIEPVEKRRIRGWKIGLFGDSRDFILGGGLNTFSITYTSGELKLRSPVLQQNDPNQFNTAGSFNKTNIELRRVQRINDAWHATARLTHQHASKNLASAEKTSVGGPYGVRAYPIGEGLADQATLFSAEVRYLIPGLKLLDAGFTLAGFIDAAHVERFKTQNTIIDQTNNVVNPNTRSLYGAGFGVRFGKEGAFSLTADLAWRVGNETPQSDVGRNPRIWIHGLKWF